MQISVTESGEIRIVSFDGDLDGQTSPMAQNALQELLGQGARFILIDCRKLSFISSVGLRVLLVAAKQAQHAQGGVRICAANESVMEVFNMTGFDTIIPVHASLDEAIEQF